MASQLFKLRGELKSTESSMLGLLGFLIILLMWFLLTMGTTPFVDGGILPKPMDVIYSFGDLFRDNELIKNVCRSLGLNLAGYFEAIAIAIPVGFLIGLYPIFRGTFQRPMDALRYVPLTAVTGLFIIWFGLGSGMKIHFLAFGILIYLLPIVVQRIDEVKDVYLKTVYTLGATDWQTIKAVYIPSVISRLSDDIRVLTAISWTYIIVAESLGSQGGIGSLIWRAGQRQGRIDKVFALLIIIIIIGVLQDKIFVALDRHFFPYKYQNKNKYAKPDDDSTLEVIWNFATTIMVWSFIGVYILFFINEFTKWFTLDGGVPILSHLFGDTAWVIHLIAFTIIVYKAYSFLNPNKRPKLAAAK